MRIQVVDPHLFFLDPSPVVFFNLDRDPDPGAWNLDPDKVRTLKNENFFLKIKFDILVRIRTRI